MALLAFEDFDGPYSDTQAYDVQSLVSGSSIPGSNHIDSTGGEFGGRAFRWGDAPAAGAAGQCTVQVPAYTGSLIFGCRYRMESPPPTTSGESRDFFRFVGTDQACALRSTGTATNTVNVKNGVGSTTGNFYVEPAVWHTFEFKITTGTGGAGTGGALTIWLDGTEVFTDNTSDWGSSTITSVDMGASDTYDVDDHRFDRLWFMDTSGTVNNDFIGGSGIRAEYILPNANGNSSGWTGSDGNSTDNYLLVDEDPLDTADYVVADTQGLTDLYGYGSVSNTGDILAVQVLPHTALPEGGGRYVRPVTRISSTDYTGTSVAVVDGKVVPLGFWEVSPATSSAWTDSEINGAEFGVELRDT